MQCKAEIAAGFGFLSPLDKPQVVLCRYLPPSLPGRGDTTRCSQGIIRDTFHRGFYCPALLRVTVQFPWARQIVRAFPKSFIERDLGCESGE